MKEDIAEPTDTVAPPTYQELEDQLQAVRNTARFFTEEVTRLREQLRRVELERDIAREERNALIRGGAK